MKISFNYKREPRQNPWCGVSSFQHFRSEKMYSDIVVRPENNMTETEPVECYPVSPDAVENGRSEGYYPDNSIAYIRALWKEFEPERGVYNYKFIEDILEQARNHGQTLIFRLMAHSTRAADDVPEWLKQLIPCPERPEGKRIKDSPTDPLFLELFLDAVRALGKRFDSDPTFYAIDVSLPGSWGEGYKLELYPDDTMTRIADVYMEAFPTTQLFTQSIRPILVDYIGKRRSVGCRCDGFGNPDHMINKLPGRFEQFPDSWKQGPISFESYWWLCEWKRRGWDIDSIIQRSLDWHISTFNPKSMPIPYEWEEKIEAWVAKMGYHFVINYAELPDAPSDNPKVKIEIENVGVAPIYQKLPFVVRLERDGKIFDFETDTDIRNWLPGKHTVSAELFLKEGMESGEYVVSVGIGNGSSSKIYFATDAELCDGFYKIGSLPFL